MTPPSVVTDDRDERPTERPSRAAKGEARRSHSLCPNCDHPFLDCPTSDGGRALLCTNTSCDYVMVILVASSRSDASEGGRERAIIAAKREGFEVGVSVAHEMSRRCAQTATSNDLFEWNVKASAPFLKISYVEGEAAKRFPFPRIRRPLRVTLSDGSVWSYAPRDEDDLTPYLRHGHLPRERRTSKGVAQFITCAHDIRELARIVNGEMEEVDDEGDGGSASSPRGASDSE